jgi:lysophospholipase L1-like esterase
MKPLSACLTGIFSLRTLITGLLLLCGVAGSAQDPQRFESEVQALKQRAGATWNPYRPTLLFTGSSSIRLWKGLQDAFPGVQIVNTGFGGSQASDLQYYLKSLVLDYNPAQVFIYEGDNDLAEGKSTARVLRDMKGVVAGIRARYPGMPVVLIAAKPSISRWKLRGRYQRYNRKLARWASSDPLLRFADVWGPMLLESGQLNTTLFIEDGLHMNSAGYQIWQQVLAPFLFTNP